MLLALIKAVRSQGCSWLENRLCQVSTDFEKSFIDTELIFKSSG